MTGVLSSADISRILELAPTHCYSEIAKKYGVSKHVIKTIVWNSKKQRAVDKTRAEGGYV